MDRALQSTLDLLVGLPLCLIRKLLDKISFHFGEIRRPTTGGISGEHILSVQCPWRIDEFEKIVTGYSDHWSRIDDREGAIWSPDTGWLVHQGHALEQFVGPYHSEFDCFIVEKRALIVASAIAEPMAGIVLDLSGGVFLRVFPSGAWGEQWRLMLPNGRHFVVGDNRSYHE